MLLSYFEFLEELGPSAAARSPLLKWKQALRGVENGWWDISAALTNPYAPWEMIDGHIGTYDWYTAVLIVHSNRNITMDQMLSLPGIEEDISDWTSHLSVPLKFMLGYPEMGWVISDIVSRPDYTEETGKEIYITVACHVRTRILSSQ